MDISTDKRVFVTIITNTLNRGHLISRCIESIQRQTYDNYEHIIADGGSTDNTETIVRSYNDPRIKYIRVEKGGPISQLKAAFEISKGEFITFLDDDDEYREHKIEKQVELLRSLPQDYGFIYGSMAYYDDKSKAFLREHRAELQGGRELLPIAIARPIICGTPSLMFRRNAFKSVGGTWISGIGNEASDWALVCKALDAGWKVAPLKDSYINVYVNHGSTRLSEVSQSLTYNEKYIRFYTYFLNEYREIISNQPNVAQYHYENLVLLYINIKQYKQAFNIWKKLIIIKPSLKNIGRYPYYVLKSLFK